jgi:hypothetical protein
VHEVLKYCIFQIKIMFQFFILWQLIVLFCFAKGLADNILGSQMNNEESGYFSVSSGKHLLCQWYKGLVYHCISPDPRLLWIAQVE